MSDANQPAGPVGARHVIIAGYGIPGRAVAEAVRRLGVLYVVIEQNPATVDRCVAGGVTIRAGDARDPAALRAAGILIATDLIVAIPDERVALQVVEAARKLSPSLRIVARLEHVSSGFEAARLGADESVVAEEVVAAELARIAARPGK